MSFWNYLGGFLVLRWLFGGRRRNRDVGGYSYSDNQDRSERADSSRWDYQRGGIYDTEDDALDDFDPTDCDDDGFDGMMDDDDF